MKRSIAILTALFAVLFSAAAGAAVRHTTDVGPCTVDTYQFGEYRLHAFATNDPLDDACFIIEGPRSLVGIELPPLTEHLDVWRSYVEDIGKPMNDIIISMHAAGGRVAAAMRLRVWATQAVKDSIEQGAAMTVMQRLTEMHPGVDASAAEITDIIEGDVVSIGGITFRITPNGDGFDVAIPAINAVYTHMLGGDTHSIVPSLAEADSMIGSARMYLESGYTTILSAHHRPEGRADVRNKINYLETLKDLAEASPDGDVFRDAMRARYPKLLRTEYLDMSAGLIYMPQDM